MFIFWGEEIHCSLTYEKYTIFLRLHLIMTVQWNKKWWRYIIFRLSNENISVKGLKYSSLIITQNYCSLNYVSICIDAQKCAFFAVVRSSNHKIFRNKKSINDNKNTKLVRKDLLKGKKKNSILFFINNFSRRIMYLHALRPAVSTILSCSRNVHANFCTLLLRLKHCLLFYLWMFKS